MAKRNQLNSLFKIDAAEGFVRYTNTVKPYHSKLLDVLIEYVYKEDVRVKVTERWNTDIAQYKSAGSNCYMRVINTLTEADEAGNVTAWYIEGHHAEAFKPGDRFLVTYADSTSHMFIVAVAAHVAITFSTDPLITRVQVAEHHKVPVKQATTIQLSVTPEYRVVGAISGENNAFMIDGNAVDQLLPGDQIIVANTGAADIDATVFTVKAAPELGYRLGIGLRNIVGSLDYTPDYEIVGAVPTRVQPLLEHGGPQDVILPGEWIVLGGHASKFTPGGRMRVSDGRTNTVYVVDSVRETTLSSLDVTTTVIPSYVSFSGSDVVTAITVRSTQEIPADVVPQGILQYPVVPEYEIVGNTATSWIVAGTWTEEFTVGATMYVTDNRFTQANKQYVISGVSYTGNTTVIAVTGGVSPYATASGVVRHPAATITTVPVVETIRGNTHRAVNKYEQDYEPTGLTRANRGDLWINPPAAIGDQPVVKQWNGIAWVDQPTVDSIRHFASGVMRLVPRVITQIAEPTGEYPIGAVWLNPFTGVSKRYVVTPRWDNLTQTYTNWIHNYTPTVYAWATDTPVDPKYVTITRAVAQVDDPLADDYGYSNTLTVDTTNRYNQSTVSVIDVKSNQLMFSKSAAIVGVDPELNKWTVNGSMDVYSGETVYVTSSTSTQGIGKYVVSRVVKNGATTDVYVTKRISRLASPDGILSAPVAVSAIPKWVEGTRVRLSSTNQLPSPVVAETPYYFIPVTKPYVLMDTFPRLNDVYTSWYRFSHARTSVYPANASELQGWEYLADTDTLRTSIDSTTAIGMVSPDAYTKYVYTVQLSSTGADDDVGGVVIAWHRDAATGKEYTLSAVRSPGGGDVTGRYTWRLVYNIGQQDAWVVADGTPFIKWGNGKYGATATQSGYTTNTSDGRWSNWPMGTSISVERDGNVFTCRTTNLGSSMYADDAVIVVDLTSDSRLAKFIGPRPVGFVSIGQNRLSFKITAFDAAIQETPAVFALSKVRKPRNYSDYVDVTTLGTGVLTLTQDELYVPGSRVVVKDSYASKNNGSYTVLSETRISPTSARIRVAERLSSTTPKGMAVDGVMWYDADTHLYSSLTERSCKTRSESELFADTRITEFIQFEFSIDQLDDIVSRVEENVPRTLYVNDVGYDAPNDEHGFDGDLMIASTAAMIGSVTQAYAHSMVPIGFDTQYFDVGGIDETVETYAKKYGKRA